MGHVLSTGIGDFIIDKKGDVYYVLNPYMQGFDKHDPLIANEEVLGTKGTWITDIYESSMDCEDPKDCYTFEGYKLDLTNIRTVHELHFGNGDCAQSIVFISRDGYLHELEFNQCGQTAPIILHLYKT
ncbi:MAG: hypothetical protein ACOXZS_01795 [Bacilli bacterium]